MLHCFNRIPVEKRVLLLQKMSRRSVSLLVRYYTLRIVEELPDRLKFLVLVVRPTSTEVLLLILVAIHFAGKVPASDYSLHSSCKQIALTFDCSKNWSRMLSDSGDAVYFFFCFFDIPYFHG